MKLIKQSFRIIEQEIPHQKMDMDRYIYKSMYMDCLNKHIELCARTCYKSESKITEDSAAKFVNNLVKSKHYAMLEHGTIYLHICDGWVGAFNRYNSNPYSVVNVGWKDNEVFITTNLRVLVENNWLDDLKYLCEPTALHTKRYTVKFITDIGVTREFIRHRKFSFANESTRYCNYGRNRFNHNITFIEPLWYKEAEEVIKSYFIGALTYAEDSYLTLIDNQYTAQDARNILPLATKSELIMTGFSNDWEDFFKLRALGTTGKPHPQAKDLAEPLMKEFIKRDYIKELK